MNRSGKSGTSLVELILVMALLALVAAVTAPSLSGYSEGRVFAGEWNRLNSLLRYARNEAIARAVPVEIQFDATRRSYWLVEGEQEDIQASSEAFADVDAHVAPEHVLPKKLCLDFADVSQTEEPSSESARNLQSRPSDVVSIVFLPDGSVDEESPKLVRLYEEDGFYQRALQYDAVRGYVVLQDEYVDQVLPSHA